MSEQNGNGETRSSRRLLSVYLFGRQRLLGRAELGSTLDVTTEFVLGRSALVAQVGQGLVKLILPFRIAARDAPALPNRFARR
jgi:hypothetical protein